MLYSLLHRPNIDTSLIDSFQKRYDPYHKLAGAHFALIFPTPDKLAKESLIEHVKNVLKNWKSFEVHIKGLEKSWDNWLFLTVQQGNDKLIKLHDELYSGIMTPFLRKDLKYSPHISLGLFTKNKNYNVANPKKFELDEYLYKKVYKEAQALNLDYRYTFDNVELFTTDDNLTTTIEIKKFYLV